MCHWGLSSPSAYHFLIMINREVPSAYDHNQLVSRANSKNPFLPSADASVLEGPAQARLPVLLGGALDWDMLASSLALLEGQAGVRTGGRIHDHPPTHAAHSYSEKEKS